MLQASLLVEADECIFDFGCAIKVAARGQAIQLSCGRISALNHFTRLFTAWVFGLLDSHLREKRLMQLLQGDSSL